MSEVNFNTVKKVLPTNINKNNKDEQIKKQPIEVENGKEKLSLALGGLAAIGAAAVAAGIAIKKGQTGKAKQAMQHAQAQARNIAKKETQELLAQKSAELAKEALSNGANYQKVKHIAKQNLTHEGKKVVKEALEEGLTAIRTKEQAVRKATTEAMESVAKAATTAKNATMGMKNASAEAVLAKTDVAMKAVEKSLQAADEVAEIAMKAPTKSNARRVRYAVNQANKAKRGLLRTTEQGNKRLTQIQEAAAKKIENIAQQQASPNHATGMMKQVLNEAKTAGTKEARALKQAMKTPAWQNAQKRLAKLSPEQLKSVIANPKSSNVEIKVAKYLLG